MIHTNGIARWRKGAKPQPRSRKAALSRRGNPPVSSGDFYGYDKCVTPDEPSPPDGFLLLLSSKADSLIKKTPNMKNFDQ